MKKFLLSSLLLFTLLCGFTIVGTAAQEEELGADQEIEVISDLKTELPETQERKQPQVQKVSPAALAESYSEWDDMFKKADVLKIGTKYTKEVKNYMEVYAFQGKADAYYRVALENTSVKNGLEFWVLDKKQLDLYARHVEGDEHFKAGKKRFDDVHTPDKGTYYILINASSQTGKYNIKIDELKNDTANSPEKSTSISKNKTYSKTIGYPGESDFYKVSLKKNHFYKFKISDVKVKPGIYIEFLTKNGDRAGYMTIKKGASNTFEVKALKSQTLYFQLWAYDMESKGAYKVRVSEEKDDAGDTLKDAASVSFNNEYTRKIESSIDTDYFKFTAKSSGKYTLKLKNSSLTNAKFIFGPKKGSKMEGKIRTLSGKSKTYTETVNVVKGKTYYLGIQSNKKATGTYRFALYNKKSIKAPGAPGSVKVKSAGHDSLKISWKKTSGASKYEIYRASSKNGKYKKAGTTTSTSFTNKKASTGTTYYYKVRAVKSVFSNTAAGKYSKTASGKAEVAKPTGVTAKASDKDSVTVTWKKTAGATRYEVYRATSPKGKYKKVTSLTKLTYTDKKLKSGTTYYYKVKAVKKSGKKTYTSDFSAMKSAATKK